MPSRPASLNLDIQDEERDIGDALLSSGSIPSSSRTFVGFQSGRTPRTTGLTPAHASSPNVSTRRTPSPDKTRPQGLRISGPSLPASLSRSTSLPRRVSERSTADISEIEREHDPQPGFSQLTVLPMGLDSAAVNRVQRWITGIALGMYSRLLLFVSAHRFDQVDFDIDQGPVVCAVYPSMALTASDVSNMYGYFSFTSNVDAAVLIQSLFVFSRFSSV